MASLLRNADIAPDAAIASTKLAAWAAHRSANGFKLTGLAAGTDPGDAVNKAQLDAAVSSSIWGGITGTLSDQTDLQAALDAKQASDGTLTAFAALTIAANSLTIGTGVDAFSQTTFAANTFPARASTGALSAKPITDFALSILDDADAAAVRTTIGAGTGSGTVTAVSIATANGVSGSSSGGATPALTIALGAITPDSVAATGTVTGSNLSGTNTGDQAGGAGMTSAFNITNTDGTMTIGADTISVKIEAAKGISSSAFGIAVVLAADAGLRFETGALAIDLDGTSLQSGVSGLSISTAGVTLAMMASLVQSTFIGRAAAAGTGVPQALTAAQAKTILDLTGTNSGDQTITLSGDVSGSGTSGITATIGAGVVTYAKIQNVSTNNRLLGRSTAGAGIIEEITVGSGLSLSAGTLTATDAGGTVTNVAVTGANGIGVSGSPITTTGTIALSLGAITPTTVNGLTLTALATGFTIAGGTTSKTLTVPLDASVSGTNTGDQIVPENKPAVSNQFLSAYNSATGVFTQVQPSFTNLSGSVVAGQMPALTGDVTTSAGTVATTIASGVVTYAKMQNVAGLSVFGRSANTSGVGADITGTNSQVLRVDSSGTTLGFGTVNAAGIAANAISTSKILDTNVSYVKIQNVAALSVFGRSANSAGVGADITGTDGQALRVSGTTLGFGTLIPGSIAMSADSRLLGRGNPGTPTAVEIVLGPGLNIKNNQLSTQAFLVQQERFSGAPTVASAGTLDLSATPEAFVDITGTTNISAVTLAVDEVKALRFTGAGLNLVQSAALLLPGGADLPTTLNGVAQVIGTAAGVMIIGYHNDTGYSVQTFDNIYMKFGGNIRCEEVGSAFNIGFSPDEYTGTPTGRSYLSIGAFNTIGVQVIDGGSNGTAQLDTSLLAGLKFFKFPNYSGTFSTITGTESLTNKKLGSLTTNGFIQTSSGDGTLSVLVPGTGVATFLGSPSSANLLAAVTDETGTGALVFGTTPTLATPVINGIATGTGVDTANTFDTLVRRDEFGDIYATSFTGDGVFVLNVVDGIDIAAASGTPIDLAYPSSAKQYITGVNTNQTFNLPAASGVPLGYTWFFKNLMTGTGTIIILTSGGNTLLTVAPGTAAYVTCRLNSGTGTGSWGATYFGTIITTAKKLSVTASLIFAGTDGTTHTFPATSSSIARIDASNTFAEAANFILGTTTGSIFGTSVSQKLAFHNSTPVIQRVGAAQAAVATTAATNATPYGFAQAQADGIVTLLNEIRDALVEKGLIKGAA